MWPALNFSTILSNVSRGLEGAIALTGLSASIFGSNSNDTHLIKPETFTLNNGDQAHQLNDPAEDIKEPIKTPPTRQHQPTTTQIRSAGGPGARPPSRRSINTEPHQSLFLPPLPSLQSAHASGHPAGMKPVTLLEKNRSIPPALTGRDARNKVLRMGGIRPTEFKSGDATKAKEQDLENIGKELARLEFALSQIKIKEDHLNMVRDRPQYGYLIIHIGRKNIEMQVQIYKMKSIL